MADNAETKKDALLKDTVALLGKRIAAGARHEMEAFIGLYFRNVIAEDLLKLTPQNVYGAALAHFKLAAVRKNGEPLIRVYNPRIETHGWQIPGTVIEIVNDDMPFLLDSTSAAISRMGIGVHMVAHPVLRVWRNDAGCWAGLAPGADDTAKAESFIHFSIDEQADAARCDEIRETISGVLAEVRAAVTGWRSMLAKIDDAIHDLRAAKLNIGPEEIEESIAFLEWLRGNNFTFLGYAEFSFFENRDGAGAAPVEGSGLGVLRDPDTGLFRTRSHGLASFSPEILESLKDPRPLIITKTDIRSKVHRNIHMDYLGVKRFGKDGAVIGERRFVGLFTSAAYSKAPADIPLLRRKVTLTIARAGFAGDSHDGKAMQNILDTYPRDELFQTPRDLLFQNCIAVLRLQERPRTRLILRKDPFGRYVSCIVFIQRERFHGELQRRIGAILAENFAGSVSSVTPEFGDSPLARVHFIIRTSPGEVTQADPEKIERQIDQAARTWSDDLRDALVKHAGSERGLRLYQKYGGSFPPDYTGSFQPDQAAHDIERMESLSGSDGMHASFYRYIEDPDDMVRFKLFRTRNTVPLSDCMPMLERMGFRVMGEHPYEISVSGHAPVWLHDFEMRTSSGAAADLGACGRNLEDQFTAVWEGRAENDGLNRLVLSAGLAWREVAVLRGYTKYLRQAGITYSNFYIESALAANAAIVRMMMALFHARFDVDLAGDRDALAASRRAAIITALESVESLDEDRILRRYLNLIDATLRTNFYQTGREGGEKPSISFKLDSAQVDELPLPRPMVEIFVYSPRVEGVHLRFGKVARGGIRWSDRREDFRTEILGLVKAQQVKNSVIIPVGAKGGFTPKRLPVGGARESIQEEAIAAYRIFISGLLDLTDNLAGGRLSTPPGVMRYDGDDPYLVVAADKGTASFSDIANEVARSYDFWLDDAFASGGSAGYDHKKMAITARGAWEAVKRHFRERGHDVQTTEFTVIGCGDMSGDVFGNGMLQSRKIRLLAAFDHRDIFIDPDPDPETSFTERERLFALPRSSWGDYQQSLISKGGGVFSRARKSIPLSPEIQQMTGLTQQAVTPAELIHALLTAETDLLWFGGIGVFIKSSRESHPDAGDKTNDAVRVDACNVRAKVIGEGANLGCTQLGRIEYALRGGAINTDAVDNSAGVDCSDHEVNIKIALGAVVQAGGMTRTQRDSLLASMTDEVAGLVLRNNYQQTQAISLEAACAPLLLDSHARFMRDEEAAKRLNRQVEFLPGSEEIAERANRNLGLTRPEIATLMAYAKTGVTRELAESDVPDADFFRDDLLAYFPEPVSKNYPDAIFSHRLKREIIAAMLANSIVNRGGVAFAGEIAEETGVRTADVVRAFAVARGALDMRALWRSLEALDNRVHADILIRLQLKLRDALRGATVWFLRNAAMPLDIGAQIGAFHPGISQLRGGIHLLLPEAERQALETQVRALMAENVPEEAARAVAGLSPMMAAPDMVMVARNTGCNISDVASVFFQIGDLLGLDWLRQEAGKSHPRDHWERLAVNAMIDDFYGQQRVITQQAIEADRQGAASGVVRRWHDVHADTVRRTRSLMDEMRASGVSVAKLAFINRQLRDLLNK